MTPEELVVAVQAAGARVQKLGDGKAKLVGAELPRHLVEEIRLQREAFLDAWDADLKGRWGKVPPQDLPMRSEPPKWRKDVYHRVERWVRRQGGDVCLWATLRAEAYFSAMEGKGWDAASATASALADVLHWQMSHWENPEWQLGVFEEVAKAGEQP